VLKAREFVFLCEELAMAAVPAAARPPERRVMWTILQFHFGNPNVHFELQPHMGRGLVEVGLHFEGPLELNDAWAEYLAGCAPEIMAGLGPEWELEAWTQSWRRLHRTYRFERLDRELAAGVSAGLAAALGTLTPLVTASPLARLACAPVAI
jgi:hypothetical protein